MEHLKEIFNRLNISDKTTAVSDEKIKFASLHKNQQDLINKQSSKGFRAEKNDTSSEEYRELGNKFYASNNFVDAMENYNKSLCFAKSKLNLSLAYANRSAVCFELKMYSTCMENIELAKLYGYPADKFGKLNERAEKCRQMIAKEAESDESLMQSTGEEHLKLSHPPHYKLSYIADCLDVKRNEEFGRHVVTKKRLLPGQIICIEAPFSKYLKPKNKYTNCHHCMSRNFLGLIPCPLATSVMFCSPRCLIEATKSYYKYEVEIIDKIHEMQPNFRSAVRVFFKALQVCDGNLELLKKITKENEKSNLTILC